LGTDYGRSARRDTIASAMANRIVAVMRPYQR
jgi:hypothetical protein